MLRILAALLLIQLIAQATGLVYTADEQACEDPTSQQESEDCTPGCEDCLCCPHHRLLLGQLGAKATFLDVRKVVFPLPSAPTEDPALGEILHVPKTGLPTPSFERA